MGVTLRVYGDVVVLRRPKHICACHYGEMSGGFPNGTLASERWGSGLPLKQCHRCVVETDLKEVAANQIDFWRV